MNKNSLSKVETILLTDGYKLDHRRQYPKGTEYVYCNFTPRSCNWYPEAKNGVVVFGIQYFIKKYLIEWFTENFFNLPTDLVIETFERRLKTFLGNEAANIIGVNHIRELHELGYLPIKIKALPEGTLCPFRVPVLTITNTDPKFFWLPNYLETLLSTELWLPMTSATTARLAKKCLYEHAKRTGFEDDDLGFLCHDFSMRGMSGIEAAILSGMGHLTSFSGSETLPAICNMEEYYNCNAEEELIAATVPATEHSVMCANGQETEIETFKRLLTEVYPKGFLSIVSDTWDYWQVITEFLPKLKETILYRDGRCVIRPDSGDPVDIICGLDKRDVVMLNSKLYYIPGIVTNQDPQYQEEHWKLFRRSEEFRIQHEVTEYQIKGTYQLLWELFGGSYTKNGYRILHPKIGLIYGDSITLERQQQIYERLEQKGFAATNLVLGFGSYTYQLKSRDSLGFAMKATWCQINGEPYDIFKSPKTDGGVKKSLKGLLNVQKENEQIVVHDNCTKQQEDSGLLETIFVDGKMTKETSLSEIRNRIDSTL